MHLVIVLLTKHVVLCHRSKFPRAGLFQCRATGLVFGTTGEGEVVYGTVQWEERCLQSTGRTPASPLFDIDSPQPCVCQLGFPHCDVTPGESLTVTSSKTCKCTREYLSVFI